MAERVSERMAAIEISDRKETDDTSGDDNGEEDRASTATATGKDLVDDIKKWDGKKRPLVLVTAGGAGVGKSKLVNNLLGLEGKRAAESGYSGQSVTKDVDVYEEVVHGVTVRIIDIPGFGSRDLSSKREGEALAMISVKTDRKADILLYCMNLTSRFDAKDEYIVKKLTKAFGKEIWQHAILVLTHGDTVLKDEGKAKLKSLVEEFTKEFHEVLTKAGVDVPVSPILMSIGPELESSAVNVNNGIVGIPVGKNRKCPEDWVYLLYMEVFKKCVSPAK